MVIALLALCFSPNASVTIESDAITLKNFVAEIARQGGVPLACGRDLETETVVAQFENRDPEEIRSKLAEVIGAQWVEKGGVPTLTRPHELQIKQERAEQKKVTAHLKAMLQSAREQLAKMPAYDEKQAALTADRYRLVEMSDTAVMAEHDRMMDSNPVARWVVKTLSNIDAVRLTQQTAGERVAYSDKPTPMQVELPSKAISDLDEVRGNLHLIEVATQRLGNPKKRFINFGDLPGFGPGQTENGWGKVVLGIKRVGACSFAYDFTAVDANGRRLATLQGRYPRNATYSGDRLPHKGDPLILSDQTSKMADLWKNVGYQSAMSRMTKLADGTPITGSFAVTASERDGKDPVRDLAEIIGDPVTHDPTAIFSGCLLRQVAQARKRPLLASLGDSAVVLCALNLNRGNLKTQNDLMKLLIQEDVDPANRVPFVEEASDETWMEIRPFLPVAERASRMDRGALRDLVTAIRRQGALTLSDGANYFRATNRRPTYGTLDWAYITHADPAVDQQSALYVFTPALALLSRFSDDQWSSGISRPLGLNDLSSDQIQSLTKLVFSELQYERVVPDREPMMGFGHTFPLDQDPTQIFPDGLPTGLRFVVEKSEKPLVQARSSTGAVYAMDADSLGLFDAMRLDSSNADALRRNLTSFRSASRIGYQIRLRLAPSVEPKLVAEEIRPAAGASYGSRESIPQPFLKRAGEAEHAFAQSNKG